MTQPVSAELTFPPEQLKSHLNSARLTFTHNKDPLTGKCAAFGSLITSSPHRTGLHSDPSRNAPSKLTSVLKELGPHCLPTTLDVVGSLTQQSAKSLLPANTGEVWYIHDNVRVLDESCIRDAARFPP
jgi:hypothetical protein